MFNPSFIDFTGDHVCHIRGWFSGIAVVGIMSNLLVKTNRIRKLVGFFKAPNSPLNKYIPPL